MSYAVTEKAYKGFGMEGFAASRYASLTLKRLEELKALARRLAEQIPAGSQVLEVAPGPAYFGIELAKLGGYQITAIDISHTRVEIAGRKAREAGSVSTSGTAIERTCPSRMSRLISCFAGQPFKNFSQPVRRPNRCIALSRPAAER
jgi:hypothetical protein